MRIRRGDAALAVESAEVARKRSGEQTAALLVAVRRSLEKIGTFERAPVRAKPPDAGALDAQDAGGDFGDQLERAGDIAAAELLGVHERRKGLAVRIEHILDLSRRGRLIVEGEVLGGNGGHRKGNQAFCPARRIQP